MVAWWLVAVWFVKRLFRARLKEEPSECPPAALRLPLTEYVELKRGDAELRAEAQRQLWVKAQKAEYELRQSPLATVLNEFDIKVLRVSTRVETRELLAKVECEWCKSVYNFTVPVEAENHTDELRRYALGAAGLCGCCPEYRAVTYRGPSE
jgi:hypothetical protein